MLVKHCRECREDYLPHIVSCADCGAELVTRDDEQPLEDAAEARLPDGDYRFLLLADNAAEADGLLERVARAGLPAQVVPSRRGVGFELRVRDEERAAIVALLADRLSGELAAAAELERHFDAGRGGYTRCPACDAELEQGVVECPGCGLPLAGELGPDVCPHCGAEASSDNQGHCRACGHGA